MSWASLPTELQEAVLGICVRERSGVLSLLLVSRRMFSLVVPLLYAELQITSLAQLRALIGAAGGADALQDDEDETADVQPAQGTLRAHLAAHTRRLTISIDGVPGAAPPPAAQDSPFRLWSGQPRRNEGDERLTLALCAMRLCNPQRLSHISLEMFGVRSKSHLGEPALEEAFGRLSALRSLRWVPPGRLSIVGFSIAVVDSAVPSIQLGLLQAALRTPTLQSSLQELHFAAVGLQKEAALVDARLAFLWALSCRLEDGRALFPRLRSLRFTSAVNLPIAPLARLLLHRALAAHAAPDSTEPLLIEIADGFSGSIWGPRLDAHDVRRHMRAFLLVDGAALLDEGPVPLSFQPQSVPAIRVLSDSLDYLPQVHEPRFLACASMSKRELEALVASAMGMLRLTALEGAIAGRTQ